MVASRRYSLVGVCGLLIAVASSCRARALGVPGSHGLSCSPAPGIFLDQGLNPYPLHWEVNSYSLLYQGRPVPCFRCCNPALLDTGTFWSCVVTGPLGLPTCLQACRLDFPLPQTLLLFTGRRQGDHSSTVLRSDVVSCVLMSSGLPSPLQQCLILKLNSKVL